MPASRSSDGNQSAQLSNYHSVTTIFIYFHFPIDIPTTPDIISIVWQGIHGRAAAGRTGELAHAARSTGRLAVVLTPPRVPCALAETPTPSIGSIRP